MKSRRTAVSPHMLTPKMEIITYVREGAVTHRDSLGNTGRIVAGDVQVMSAGTGIRHAEFNLEPKTTIGDSCRITLHQLAAKVLRFPACTIVSPRMSVIRATTGRKKARPPSKVGESNVIIEVANTTTATSIAQ